MLVKAINTMRIRIIGISENLIAETEIETEPQMQTFNAGLWEGKGEWELFQCKMSILKGWFIIVKHFCKFIHKQFWINTSDGVDMFQMKIRVVFVRLKECASKAIGGISYTKRLAMRTSISTVAIVNFPAYYKASSKIVQFDAKDTTDDVRLDAFNFNCFSIPWKMNISRCIDM